MVVEGGVYLPQENILFIYFWWVQMNSVPLSTQEVNQLEERKMVLSEV